MKNLKVGDRVRINCPISHSRTHGKTGTIWQIVPNHSWHTEWEKDNGKTAFRVDVDGIGKRGVYGGPLSYLESELIPLVPPDELAWQQFREHLKPNPAIIFDADPVIVSTDEEAERIAETVPNSHIKVVIRGVVVSEYFGQSQTNHP